MIHERPDVTPVDNPSVSTRAIVAPRWRRALVLLGGLVALVVWQSTFFRHGYPDTTLQSEYRLEASAGHLDWQQEFVYFLYYLNLFPVASISRTTPDYSVEGARRMIAEQGHTLVMDRYWTIRYGELAKTYLYLPHVWLKGKPVRPRMLHANAVGFTVALLVLFTAFWYVEQTTLGVVLVVLMGSNPFQVNQVYATNNVLGWPITVTLLLLALHVPLIAGRLRRFSVIIGLALLSGAILGTVRQVRTEPVLVFVAVAGVYLAATHLRSWIRLTAVVLLGVTVIATSSAWTGFFEGKYRQAYTVVKAAGGHVYDGPRYPHHFFWHALSCGLGDFDRKYGYRWSDTRALSYAWPILQHRYDYRPVGYPPLAPRVLDLLTFGVYWDRGRQYVKTPFEIPEYIEIVRNKVLGDIVHDPLWYASILGRRLARILTQSTPPTVALGNGWFVSLPGRAVWGYLAVVVALALLRRRAWFGLKLIAFTVPLAGTALLVYSGGGTALYSVAHLVAFAIAAAAVIDAVRRRPRLGIVLVVGKQILAWPETVRGVVTSFGKPGKSEPQLAPRAISARFTAAVVAIGLLFVLAGWTVAQRIVPPASAGVTYKGAPDLAILRFENQTWNERLAWLGDAVGELVATEMAHAGVRVIGPDAVDYLDPDLVWWGPYSVLSVPRALALNVVADRTGAERLLLGRVYSGPKGLLVCATLFAAQTRGASGPEHCEPVNGHQLSEVSRRLAATLRPIFGVSGTPGPAIRSASDHGDALRLYTEARRAVRRQMWGEATRLVADATRDNAGFLEAEMLQARLRARWQPLDREALGVLTGTTDLAEALTRLRATLSSNSDQTDLRLDLGRILVALELYDEAEEVLAPLQRTPGSPTEAFGLLAESASSRGDLGRAYQVLLEYQWRSWQEPRGISLLAEHLIRWQDLRGASLSLENAEKERVHHAEAEVTLDDLVRAWRVRALEDEWSAAQEQASRMVHVDDPRAEGVGDLYLARGYLFQGRSRLASALAEEAAFRLARQDLDPAPAVRMAVDIRLDEGDVAGALGVIKRAGPASASDPRVALLETIALQKAGRLIEAHATRKRLGEQLSQIPGPTGMRLLHLLDGKLALMRGDTSAALRSLSQAESLLPARGFCGDHVPVWYALAQANLAAKDSRQAGVWLQRIVGAGYERLCWPIPYARSFSLLGRIAAADNHNDKAARSFEQFLALWGDGDLAATETRQAREFLDPERSLVSAPGRNSAGSQTGR
jgi:tetratricopeptide (TPR) repeat protein